MATIYLPFFFFLGANIHKMKHFRKSRWIWKESKKPSLMLKMVKVNRIDWKMLSKVNSHFQKKKKKEWKNWCQIMINEVSILYYLKKIMKSYIQGTNVNITFTKIIYTIYSGEWVCYCLLKDVFFIILYRIRIIYL